MRIFCTDLDPTRNQFFSYFDLVILVDKKGNFELLVEKYEIN